MCRRKGVSYPAEWATRLPSGSASAGDVPSVSQVPNVSPAVKLQTEDDS